MGWGVSEPRCASSLQHTGVKQQGEGGEGQHRPAGEGMGDTSPRGVLAAPAVSAEPHSPPPAPSSLPFPPLCHRTPAGAAPDSEGGQQTPTGKKNLFYSYGGNKNSAAAPLGTAATSPIPAAPAWGQAAAAPPASRPRRRRGAGRGLGGSWGPWGPPHSFGCASGWPCPPGASSSTGQERSWSCVRHPAPRQVPPAAAGPVLEVRGCATQPSCPTAPLCGCSSALSYSSPSAPSWHHKFNTLGADPGQPNKAPHVFLAAEQLRAGEGQGCWGFPPRLPHYPPRGVGMLPASRSPAPTAQGGSSWVPGGCCSPIKNRLG